MSTTEAPTEWEELRGRAGLRHSAPEPAGRTSFEQWWEDVVPFHYTHPVTGQTWV